MPWPERPAGTRAQPRDAIGAFEQKEKPLDGGLRLNRGAFDRGDVAELRHAGELNKAL